VPPSGALTEIKRQVLREALWSGRLAISIAASVIFASYNVHKCVGSDRRFDPERVAEVIAEIGPDVIALQEADRRFGDRAGLLDLPALERRTGLVPVPIESRHSGHGWHGNVVLVRSGLVRELHQVSLPGLEPRGALVVDLDLEPGPLRLVAAHLGLLRHSRRLQIRHLLTHAADDVERPTVLMGDLNEWRRDRRSALHGFAPHFGPVSGGAPSFPAHFPVLALDRIFATPAHILGPVETHASPLARKASDHLPVKTRVDLNARLQPPEARDRA
jgi:endonuclease/exonuclease/phosphatase family metal-dependent hydrolase